MIVLDMDLFELLVIAVYGLELYLLTDIFQLSQICGPLKQFVRDLHEVDKGAHLFTASIITSKTMVRVIKNLNS